MSALYAHPLFVPLLLIWAVALPLLTQRAPRLATLPTPEEVAMVVPEKPKPKPKTPASLLPPPPPSLGMPPIGKYPKE